MKPKEELKEKDVLRDIADDLTEGFILREYQVENPQMDVDFKQKAILLYQNDYRFHARVQHITAGVLRIVQKHIDD